MNKTYKQVIVIRTDLNMRKGKMCSQAAHASLTSVLKILNDKNVSELEIFDKWFNDNNQTKITVGIGSEKELLELEEKCKSLNVPYFLVTDAGKTEFNGIPTKTAIGIGPYESEKINEITGNLKLL